MKKPTEKEILDRVEEWFPGAQNYWKPHHDRSEYATRFSKATKAEEMWTDKEIKSRGEERLTLAENLLGPFGNQVVNDIRQSDYGALVKPKDNGTDPVLAEVRQGLHRGVQQIGGWKDVLAQAADDLVFGGLGAFRFVTQQRDPSTMRKEIQWLEVDPRRIFHGDGTHRKRNFSDVTDSLIYEPYSKERFKHEFKRDPQEFLGKTDTNGCWGRGDTPWVDDYWFVKKIPDTLIMYQGKEYYASDEKLLALADSMGMDVMDLADFDKDGEPIIESSYKCQVWNAKLVHRKVLRVDLWPGSFIPNFIATGRKVSIKGEVKYVGLLEPAFDVQKAHNYAFSALVERSGMAPKMQVMMPIEGMDPKFQKIYDNIASWNGVVPYKSLAADGTTQLDKPSREAPIQTDPAFADLRAMTTQGIRDCLGMWETSLGAQSNEKSGIAIQTRERQADTGNFDWGANLAIPAEHCFQCVDEILHEVYDTPTQVRIVGEDDKEKVLMVAAMEENDPNQGAYYNLNQGKYDIYCKMAPSNDTKREEQMRGMEMLFQKNPQLAAGLAPAYIVIQDWKGAKEMAEDAKAIRSAQFPGVQFSDSAQGEGQVPPAVAQQLQQMQQQMQAMGQQLQDVMPKMQQLQVENAKLTVTNHSIQADKAHEARRLEIEQFKADTERMKALGEAKAKEGNLLLTADKQQHEKKVDAAELALKAEGQAHQADQDNKNFALSGAKAAGDHALKESAQADAREAAKAKANGGDPGKPAAGRKT